MAYEIYIVICLGILLIVGATIIIRRELKNKVPKDIPENIMKEFNRAEELMREYKGTITPQEILWKINEERKNVYTHIQDVPLSMRKDVTDEAQQLQQPQQAIPQKPRINLGGLFRRK